MVLEVAAGGVVTLRDASPSLRKGSEIQSLFLCLYFKVECSIMVLEVAAGASLRFETRVPPQVLERSQAGGRHCGFC
jgi:hypothetical protein